MRYKQRLERYQELEKKALEEEHSRQSGPEQRGYGRVTLKAVTRMKVQEWTEQAGQ